MNIQPGRMNRSGRVTSARKDPDFIRQLGRVVKLVMFLALVSSVLVVHIYLNQRITETQRQIRTVQANIEQTQIENTNLRNRLEACSSREFINRQMVRFGLKLVPAEPGQVRYMAIMPTAQARRIAIQMENARSRLAARQRTYRSR